MREALIDADYLCYKVGFITQDGRGEDAYLNQEAKFYKSHVDRAISQIMRDLQTKWCRVFLSSSITFRSYHPTYKANRKDLIKPLMGDKIKNYLLSEYPSDITSNLEADDRVIIEYNKSPTDTVMCHLDKDLNQAPGLHYRFSNRGTGRYVYKVTELEGTMFLYQQSLEGDTADNIKGVKGYGPKKAQKALEGATTEAEMYTIVKGLYDSEERLINNMLQLYLLRHEEDVWVIPTKKTKKLSTTIQIS